MEKRTLGRSAIEVAPLALGGNVFGWTIDESQSFQILDRFAGGDFNLIDTADVYSNWLPGNKGGESETIIGNWMKERGNRNQVVIATKVGSSMERGEKKQLSKKYILTAIEDSLKRLQTDYIDLYQSHYDDLQTHPQETLEAYATLIQRGKIRWIGASNLNAERLTLSLKVSDKLELPRYATFQPQYNLYDREEFETTTGPVCQQYELSVIPYYGLASGFLTGKYRSENDLNKSPRGQGIKKYLNERGYRILAALDSVAERYHSTPAIVSLAWLMSKPGITAPIASATTVQQMDELMKAATITLDIEAMEELNRASEY